MQAFADLSASFHRDQILGGNNNNQHLEGCFTVINLLHQVNGVASSLESSFNPEPKKKVSLFPAREQQEVIDVCPE